MARKPKCRKTLPKLQAMRYYRFTMKTGKRLADPPSGQTEAEFLKEYKAKILNNPIRHPRPSVTADIVPVALRNRPQSSQVVPFRLKPAILLIRRGGHPFKGCWALPGGFLTPDDEDIEACARRELKEETNLSTDIFFPIGNFTKPGRDPRAVIGIPGGDPNFGKQMWVLSMAYLAAIRKGAAGGFHAKAGSDAADVCWCWFDLAFEKEKDGVPLTGGATLTLTPEGAGEHPDREEFNVPLQVVHTDYGRITFEVRGRSDLSFDHGAIIASAIWRMRQDQTIQDELAFAFIDKEFTIRELQDSFELLGGRSLLAPNFRRRILGLVEEVKGPDGKAKKQTAPDGKNLRFRPASLFTRK